MAKEGYEPVPDVEKGAKESSSPPADSQSYADLADDQAALLQKVDNAMGMAKLDFSMPQVDPAELVSQGRSMLRSMILPTVTALLTAGAGLLIDFQAQRSNWAEIVVEYFAYWNALIVFASSVAPLSTRLKDAVKPVFDRSDKVQDDVKNKVGDITVQVDTTIDDIQAETGEVLKPIKPTIDKASGKAGQLRQIDPSLEIPDSSEIDEEFDELQGKIGSKVKEAQDALDLEQYIPGPLKSLDNFFWQVMVPILILALLLQLALAWASTEVVSVPSFGTSTSTARIIPTRRRLRGGSSSSHHRYDDVIPSPLRHLQRVDPTPATTATSSNEATGTASKNNAAAHEGQGEGEEEGPIQQAEEDVVEWFDEAKEEVTTDTEQAVDWVKVESSEGMDAVKDQMHAMQANARSQSSLMSKRIKQKQDKKIILDVILSYLMALLQTGLVFLFTSPRVKAAVMNRMMTKVKDQTNRTLREYGVTTTLENVMGWRLGRLRQKLLKIFTSVGKIQGLLDKIPDIAMVGKMQDRSEEMLGKVGKKQRSFLGGLLGKN